MTTRRNLKRNDEESDTSLSATPPMARQQNNANDAIDISNGINKFVDDNFSGLGDIVNVIKPSNVWPVLLLYTVLTATIDFDQFPTGAVIVGYLLLMLIFRKIRLSFTWTTTFVLLLCLCMYFCTGLVWFWVKWWSFLRDAKISTIIMQVPDGQETAFYWSMLTQLYPHVIYWPLSIGHTIVTVFGFQVYEHIAMKFSQSFVDMLIIRKQELQTISNITVRAARTL